MKHTYAFFSLALFAALISCNKDPETFTKTGPELTSVATSFHLIGGKGYVILIKTSGHASDPIYVLRTDSSYAFDRTISVIGVSESDKGIDILQEDGTHVQLGVGSSSEGKFNGYGLSTVSGEYHYLNFYRDGRPVVDPDVDIVKCQCIENSVSRACDAGGRGATDCSIEHSGSIAGTGVNFKCNVKCGTGYFACCRNY